MFSRRVEHVSATKIFAGDERDGRQSLIYSMTISTREPLAMVLPLPVPANGPGDAIEFVNLEGYAELFTDLKKAFPDTTLFAQPASRSFGPPVMNKLVVHEVGAFVASYVPHSRDFGRLDPRFRLPPNVLAALPHYADWGFAVFQLDASKQKAIHPMAMRFPRREPGAIYFPLTHVHDGSVPASAHFDHALYAQLPPVIAALTDFSESTDRLGAFVDGSRAKNLIDTSKGGHARALLGELPNRDLWMRPPPVTVEDLSGEGPGYRYRVGARYHYASKSHHSYPKWLETSATKLPALCRGMRDGIAELTTRNARAWQLGVFDQATPYFMNGSQLWRGIDYRDGRHDPEPQGRGYIAFRPFSTSVEQQDIAIAFETMPNQDDAVAINRALGELLERIAREA